MYPCRANQTERHPGASGKQPTTALEIGQAAFRVCTAQDFDASSKRKTGLPSTACHMCRLRKVKCHISVSSADRESDEAAGPVICRACKQSNIECRWDTIDRRKRRKLGPRATDEPSPHIRSPAIRAENQSHEHRDSNALNTALSTSQLPQQPERVLGVYPSPTRRPLRSEDSGQPPSMSHGDSSMWGPDQVRDTDPGLGEFCSYENLRMPDDWPDIQDFILDFEGIEHLGTSPRRRSFDSQNDSTVRSSSNGRKAIRLRFYRRFGPTAIFPGLRRLSIAVDSPRQRQNTSERESPATFEPFIRPHAGMSVQASPTPRQRAASGESPYDLDIDSIHEILDVFFKHFGGHFPFLNPRILGGHVRSGQASSFLINAITALTMRVFPSNPPSLGDQEPRETQWRRGAPFLKRAKEQLVSLLGIPEPEVVAGLLILAWAEFGDNNEAGLWMLSGMAIRMAQDLGFHRSPKRDSDPQAVFYDHTPLTPEGKEIVTDEQSALHQQKARLVMFWSVFIIDVCVSLLTGRPPTLRRAEIDVLVPTAQDMKLTQLDFEDGASIDNLVFPQMVHFMVYFSEAVELLNRHRVSERVPERDVSHDLARAKQSLMVQYQSLGPELIFTIENYKKSACNGHSGLFLMLHLYFYTFIILLSHQSPGDVGQGNHDDGESFKTALMACQKIVQILNTAELVDQQGYLSSPFTSHCLFVAASVLLQDPSSARTNGQDTGDLLSIVGVSDLNYLRQKLQEQSWCFGGVRSTLAELERRKRYLVASGNTNGQGSADEESDEDQDQVVELGDPGIMSRYAIPG